MQVKKYRARTIREATIKVKNLLGPEAMIISTKKLEGSGVNSGFEIAAMPPLRAVSKDSELSAGDLRSELTTLREMIGILHHADGFFEKMLMTPESLNVYAALIKSGVSDVYAKRLLDTAGVFDADPSGESRGAREKTLKAIRNVIQIDKPFHTTDQRRVVAALIGTTGVGKTTTIAKLAAQLMLKAGKKVGLISIDTYRIGAMEQLKAYADILGIPCFQAYKRQDLTNALNRLEDKEVILIDTAGQSQYDGTRLEDLRTMLGGKTTICVHLLLNIGTQQAEMANIAMNFSPLEYRSYIFTKADESERCGSVLNQIMKNNLPISFLTTGQNVPQDIEAANKSKILNLLFNKN